MIHYNPEIDINSNQPFPLNAELFDIFLSKEQYTLNAKIKKNDEYEPMPDGLALYHIVIGKMIENGVQFSSPGNSRKRNFICWFNSHFFIDQPYSHSIEIKENYFELVYDIVLNIVKEKQLTKNKLNDFEKLKIEGIENLTLKGKEFIAAIYQ